MTALILMLAFVIALVFVFIVAFFSGSETAVISISRLKLKLMANSGFRNAQILQEMMKEQEMLVSAMLVGLNIFVILGSTVVTALLVLALGEESKTFAVTITTLVLTPLYLIFGELIPKTIFRRHATRLALKHVYRIRLTYRILLPVIRHVTLLLNLIKKFTGVGGRSSEVALTKDDIQKLIEMSEEEGILNSHEGEMIHSVFEFSELPVRDVMTPRSSIISVPIDASLADLVTTARANGFSRIPVYENDMDHMAGFIYIRDLFGQDLEGCQLRDFLRPFMFMPETKHLGPLLGEMQKGKTQMAILVDEYGGVAGLCTMEDIIEEIVGDIRDEFDREEPLVQALQGNVFVIAGIMDLEEFCEEFSMSMDEEVESITVGGFIIEKLGRVPSEGETVKINGMKFVIERVDRRRIFKVKYVTDKDRKENK